MAAPRLIAVVVLPTPPFWLAIAMMRPMECRPIMFANPASANENRKPGDVPRGTSGELLEDRDPPRPPPRDRQFPSEPEARPQLPQHRRGISSPREQAASVAQELRVADPGVEAADRPGRRHVERLPADFFDSSLEDRRIREAQGPLDVPEK